MLLPMFTFSQVENVDMTSFMKDTQIQNSDLSDGKYEIMWYVPLEFWQISLQNNNELSESDRTMMLDLLGQYTIIAIVDGELVDALNGRIDCL